MYVLGLVFSEIFMFLKYKVHSGRQSRVHVQCGSICKDLLNCLNSWSLSLVVILGLGIYFLLGLTGCDTQSGLGQPEARRAATRIDLVGGPSALAPTHVVVKAVVVVLLRWLSWLVGLLLPSGRLLH